MSRDTRARRWATGIAIASIAILAATTLALYVSARRLSQPAYTVGERSDLPSSLYESASRTLLIVARSSCSGCQAAKPFLTSLAAETRRQPNSRVTLLVEERRPEEAAFGSAIGIGDEEIQSLDLKQLKVRRVPTVLLVDGRGTILFAHEDSPVAVEESLLLARFREALK